MCKSPTLVHYDQIIETTGRGETYALRCANKSCGHMLPITAELLLMFRKNPQKGTPDTP